jgi:hypothetical protein
VYGVHFASVLKSTFQTGEKAVIHGRNDLTKASMTIYIAVTAHNLEMKSKL